MKRKKYIWFRISGDAYELPEVLADSAEELAAKTGSSPGTIKTEYCKWAKGKIKKCRWRRVEVEDQDADLL